MIHYDIGSFQEGACSPREISLSAIATNSLVHSQSLIKNQMKESQSQGLRMLNHDFNKIDRENFEMLIGDAGRRQKVLENQRERNKIIQ